MRPGETFELACYKHLKNTYRTKETDFRHEGGMDSTKSDIAAIRNDKIAFYIEAKDAAAQSGQFVLLPDVKRECFVFSPRNRSRPNAMTDIIISYMNQNFQRFCQAGTAGQLLSMDTCVFAQWITQHYESKNVKYVISYKNGYVIFPIRKFSQYFEITAHYRIKKSGSSEPAKKDIPAIVQIITEYYASATFSNRGKKLFVHIAEEVHKNRFVSGAFTYYLSYRDPGIYEIRKLSNTNNMNVIFSINLIKGQDTHDLAEFQSDLNSPSSSL